jgi:hypothetical protein
VIPVDQPSKAVRVLAGVVVPLVLVAATLVPLVVFGDRLPEPVATHWALDGTPDGSTSQGALLVLFAAMVGLPAALMVAVARRRDPRRFEVAVPLATGGFVAALMAGVSLSVVVANLDVDDWTAATSVGWMLPAVLAFAVAVAVGLGAVGRRMEIDDEAPASLPSAGLAPGVRAVWVGSARSTWGLPFTLGFFVTGIALMVWVHLALGFFTAVVGFVGLAFTSVQVTVDHKGLRIRFGALSWPVMAVGYERIVSASVIEDLRPVSWGGWGYRGSLKVFGRAAVVLRRGPALQVELRGDKVLVVTVDDAVTAAGVLNDLSRGRSSS